MSSREQLPLIRNVTRNVLAWFKKIRTTNPLVSDSLGCHDSQRIRVSRSMRGFPRPCMGPGPIVAGFRSKGQDRSRDRTGLDLRSGSQEKSCGVGLRGFESHPPHHFTGTNEKPEVL